MPTKTTKPCCKGCGGPLDAYAIQLLQRKDPVFVNGILGACCAGRGGEDDGWGDASAPIEGDV